MTWETRPRSERNHEYVESDTGTLYTLNIEIDLAEGTTRSEAIDLLQNIQKTTTNHETHGTAYPSLTTYTLQDDPAPTP